MRCPTPGRSIRPSICRAGSEAYYRAPIFARVSGYLKSWSADIGAQVKAGQVIAEIEAPDLDQQLLQARADLASQQASAKLSEATLNRRKTLVASNFVSAQEIDERTADLSNKKAAVNSGQANVERLEALAGYKKITVPFDGVVTARDTDVGALINAGGGTGPAMFVVSDITKLRVYVNVPQNYVPAIKIGAKAVIVDAGISEPDLCRDGRGLLAGGRCRLRHDADAARARQFRRRVDARRLCQCAHAPCSATPCRCTFPASALIFNSSGLRVATVGADDKVLFKTVTIARDLGREIETRLGPRARRPRHHRPAGRHRRRRPGPRRRRRRQGQAGDRVGEAGREGVGRLTSLCLRRAQPAMRDPGIQVFHGFEKSVAGRTSPLAHERARKAAYATRHSGTPSSAIDDIAQRAHRRAVHVAADAPASPRRSRARAPACADRPPSAASPRRARPRHCRHRSR